MSHGASGSVLVFVVWTVAVLSVMAAGLGMRGVFALGVTERLEQQLKTAYIAAGGVQYALVAMSQDQTPETDRPHEAWQTLNEWIAWQNASGYVEVGPGLADEDGQINLNTASLEVLQNLLGQVGVPEGQLQAIAAAIVDWRDADDIASPQGAEGSYYRNLEAAYDAKDGPFESVEELLLVRGVTPALWARLAPLVTVYGSGRLNINTAGVEALTALGLSAGAVGAILNYCHGEDGEAGTGDDRVFRSASEVLLELEKSFSDQDRIAWAQLMGDFLAVKSDDFWVSITARTKSEKDRVHLTAVVSRSGQVKAWHEE